MTNSVLVAGRLVDHSIESRKVGLLSKLFVWSIVFEPLLFFNVGDPAITGFGVNFGRLLQVFVLVGLMVRLLIGGGRLKFPFGTRTILGYYSTYIYYAIFAGILGLVLGKYTYYSSATSSSLTNLGLINSPSLRPLWEYFTLVFQFTYFVFLPVYFFRGSRVIAYFFRAFMVAITVHFALGWMDLFLNGMGIEFLPRSIADGVHVGFRFHGLAGEPRDAYVFMFFVLAVLGLRAKWMYGRITIGKFLIFALVISLTLTQSASGMLGTLIGLVLLIFFPLHGVNIRRLLNLALYATLILLILYVATMGSQRTLQTLNALANVLELFADPNRPVPPILTGQYNNIYPIIDMYQDLKAGNFLSSLFGSGLGSSGFANSKAGFWDDQFTNPHSQIIRSFYETGLIGLYILVRAFVKAYRVSTRHWNTIDRRWLFFVFMLLIGGYLAHRSSTLLIFVGVLIAVTNQQKPWSQSAEKSALIR
jgi:hypothetical protein